MRKLLCPDLLDDSYRFTESGLYYSPPSGTLAQCLEYINNLPVEDSPETFGLHQNADITFQQKETRYI